ncbi:MAG: ABC transporter permease [Gammaproteobacteria bacterium]
MTSFSFALRSLIRDLKAGELTVLLTAIIVAVSSMTAVGFFTDRVGRAVEAQAAETLAADLVIQSPNAISEHYLQEARALGLEATQAFGFPSVVMVGTESSLATISAVDTGYPLRGNLLVSDKMFGTTTEPGGIPAAGEAWAEPGLLARLGADAGTTIKIGSAFFTVTRVLEYRPDQNLGFMGFAPAVIVNLNDVPAMEVVSAGSRVTYKQLFAGDKSPLDSFKVAVKPKLKMPERLRTIEDAGEQITASIDRARRFLTLASLVTVILAAVATAMAARRYALRHLDNVALVKSLGATQSFIQTSTFLQLITLTLITAGIGSLIGYLAQYTLAVILADVVQFDLPEASLQSGLLGLVTAATIAIGFALPHLLQLKTTPPLRVLRHDLPPPPLRNGVVYGIAFAALLAMIFSIVRDIKLLVYISGGLLGMAAASVAAGWMLVNAFTRLRGAAGVAWRYGLANIARRGRESVVQIVAFGLSLMVLLLLTLVRNDLLQEWRRSLPEDAPNYFLINIQPETWTGISKLFADELGIEPDFAPLIRGRISAIRGTPVGDIKFPNRQGAGFVRREANLTWTGALPETNRVMAGEWWGTDYEGAMQISLETGIAQSLGVKLGDEITLSVGGEEFVVPVTSLRFVEWDSFSPNFYLVLSPGEVQELPQTYLSSVYVSEDQRDIFKTLLRRYPDVTLLDLEVALMQVRSIIDKASLAVQYVFLFTLLAGVVVLLAAIQVTRDERRFESAILHTLGAKRITILQGIAAEFFALGGLAGFLAALGATAVAWAISVQLFELSYRPDPSIWFAGLIVGALIVGFTGTFATRKAVNEPPVRVLRDG